MGNSSKKLGKLHQSLEASAAALAAEGPCAEYVTPAQRAEEEGGAPADRKDRGRSQPEAAAAAAAGGKAGQGQAQQEEEEEVGGTYRFQGKLEKLPVPPLEDTCARLLDTVAPWLDDAEMEETREAVEAFLGGAGPEMQETLKEYAKDKDNYVDAFWDDAYLLPNDSVVVNVNPFFVLQDDPTPGGNEQIARATNLVFSMCKFVHALRAETLEPDVVKGTPLCMSQFHKVLGSTRIPREGRDEIQTFPESTHIVVTCRNQFYALNVVAPDGAMLLSHEALSRALLAIFDDAQEETDARCFENAFGVLTSADRREWAQQREAIERISQENVDELRTIDEAIFVLCLDTVACPTPQAAAANALRGTSEVDEDGVETGSCASRWYDKLQLIVAADASASVCFEHTPADGHTVLRVVSDVFTDTIIRFAQAISGKGAVNSHMRSVRFTRREEVQDGVTAAAEGLSTEPRRIQLELDDAVRAGIQEAYRGLRVVMDQYQVGTLEFTGYGKRFIVSNSMSPDAFVQQCMMASVFRVTGEVANTYESVMTKRFLLGRTEAGRSVTPEAKRYVELANGMQPSSPDKAETEEALRAACKAHSAMTRRAGSGLGVDRHLFALRCAWQQAQPDAPLPALFSSPGYQKLGVTILSTSNCGNPALKLFGFGPVSADGIGIGYIIKDGGISFSLCSKSIPVAEVAEALQACLAETKTMLRRGSKRFSLNPRALVRRR